LVADASRFFQDVPRLIEDLRPTVEAWQLVALREAGIVLLDRAGSLVQNPGRPPEDQVVEAGATALHAVFGFVTIFVLAFYWMVERPSIKRGLLRLVPAKRARDVNRVWTEIEEKLGGWVRGQIILMLAIGVMAGVGFAVLGLPNPILLAVFAALTEVIPIVGPVIGGAPAVLVALAIDPVLAIVTVIYIVIIQQIENHVLVPRVMGRSVGVSPLAVILGILIGSALYGLPGAFLAVPVAGAIQVILAYLLRTEDPEKSDEEAKEAARHVIESAAGQELVRPVPAGERPTS
jgi:predicted PurR-regulated permease PerM